MTNGSTIAQLAERSACLVGLVHADEPDGRLGHEEHEAGGDGGEPKLGAEDGSVCPSRLERAGEVDNDGGGEGADGEHESAQTSEESTQS